MSAAWRPAESQALEGVGFSILDFRLLPLFPGTSWYVGCIVRATRRFKRHILACAGCARWTNYGPEPWCNSPCRPPHRIKVG